MILQNKWEVKSHSYAIADTGDYDGYWEVTNGNARFTTREDYDEIETDLQRLADALNHPDLNLSIETDDEINLHCEAEKAKMLLSEEKQRAQKLAETLKEFISMHETGLLPNRFTYLKGKEALAEWDKGGEV